MGMVVGMNKLFFFLVFFCILGRWGGRTTSLFITVYKEKVCFQANEKYIFMLHFSEQACRKTNKQTNKKQYQTKVSFQLKGLLKMDIF